MQSTNLAASWERVERLLLQEVMTSLSAAVPWWAAAAVAEEDPRTGRAAAAAAVAAEAVAAAAATLSAPAQECHGSRWCCCCRPASTASARTGVMACLEFYELTYAASCFPATDAEYTDFVYCTCTLLDKISWRKPHEMPIDVFLIINSTLRACKFFCQYYSARSNEIQSMCKESEFWNHQSHFNLTKYFKNVLKINS